MEGGYSSMPWMRGWYPSMPTMPEEWLGRPGHAEVSSEEMPQLPAHRLLRRRQDDMQVSPVCQMREGLQNRRGQHSQVLGLRKGGALRCRVRAMLNH